MVFESPLILPYFVIYVGRIVAIPKVLLVKSDRVNGVRVHLQVIEEISKRIP